MKNERREKSADNAEINGGECLRTRIQFPGTIRKNGSSYYVTVPGQYLAKMDLKEGDDVDIRITLPDSDAPSEDRAWTRAPASFRAA